LRQYYVEVLERKVDEVGHVYYACMHRCYGDEQVGGWALMRRGGSGKVIVRSLRRRPLVAVLVISTSHHPLCHP
jgi:hypothetical protein